MKKITIVFTFVLTACCCSAQQINLDVSPYLSGFTSPVDIANAGDGTNRLFVVEQEGVIKIVEADTIRSIDFLDITDRVESGGERGLLGLAFHPNFASNGFLYVNYVRSTAPRATRISRFRVGSNPNRVNPATERILLEFEQPFGNHNGGDLNFGPNDGYLYIATGDGGSGGDPGNRAQNPLDLLGKMLRIDVDNGLPYTIPGDNPFEGATDTLEEIWSLGLRNPWRFSFDKLNGNMWIADVGQGDREELNFEPANSTGGLNWGWRCYEGSTAENLTGCGAFADYDAPIFEYTHTNNGTDAYGFSVTGGFVYRGTSYPDMQGWYFMADYLTNHFWAVNHDGVNTTIEEFTNIGENEGLFGISTFGEAENGELFVAILNSGTLYQVIDLAAFPVDLIFFEGKTEEKGNLLDWATATERNAAYFAIERSEDGLHFQEIGKVAAEGDSYEEKSYAWMDKEAGNGAVYYRLRMVDEDETFRYSKTIVLHSPALTEIKVFPNPTSGWLTIQLSQAEATDLLITCYNSQSEMVFQSNYPDVRDFKRNYDLTLYPKGIYLLEMSDGERQIFTKKIVIE